MEIEEAYQEIPTTITLRDGRTFVTKDLLVQTNYRSINLRNPDAIVKNYTYKFPMSNAKRRRKMKYSLSERRWICNASVQEIVDRYKLAPMSANSLRSLCRKMFQLIEKGELDV